MSKHLVISVGGGPLAALYGTPLASPSVFFNEIAKAIYKSGASTVELICVDPNTNASYSHILDQHEAGFINPDYSGLGWNAKLFKKNPHGGCAGNYASFHQFCGSDSTNLNNGNWRKNTDRANDAIRVLEERLGLKFKHHLYMKAEKSGVVPTDLQMKVRTPYLVQNRKKKSLDYYIK